MEIIYCDYTIELFEDNAYSQDSADIIFNYDKVYNCGEIHIKVNLDFSCFMYTLIENAKLNGLVPYEYLRCLFDQAADLDENSDWSKLLPWSIKITPWKDLGQW